MVILKALFNSNIPNRIMHYDNFDDSSPTSEVPSTAGSGRARCHRVECKGKLVSEAKRLKTGSRGRTEYC